MMKTANRSVIEIWLKISKSDLRSARLLYDKKQYRTSYYLFQQATEKANKALLLFYGMATEEMLYDARHDQFKILRRKIFESDQETTKMIALLDQFPDAKEHEISKKLSLEKQQEASQKSLKLIDDLWRKDLLTIPSVELNQLIKEVKNSFIYKIRLPQKFEKNTKGYLMKFADWAGSFKTKKSIKAQKALEQFAKSEIFTKEMHDLMNRMIDVTIDLSLSFYIVYICAFITTQHSSKTRYPKDGFNPLKFYNSRLPIIKKQAIFMNLLEDALRRLEKQIKLKYPDSYV